MSAPAGLSLIIPVATTGPDAVARIKPWLTSPFKPDRPYEVILVDQTGNPDALGPVLGRARTAGVLSAAGPGPGDAFRAAIPKAKHPLIGFAAVDYPHEPADLMALVKRLEEVADPETGQTLDLVTGFRTGQPYPVLMRAAGAVWRGFWNFALNLGLAPDPGWLGHRARRYAAMNRFLFGTRVRDIDTGLKVFRRSVFDRFEIQSSSGFVHAEILAKANFLGAFMDEVPLSPKPTSIPASAIDWKEFRAVFASPRFRTPGSDPMTLTIDAHQHFWKTDNARFDYSFLKSEPLAPINRDFLPADLKPHLDARGVHKCVFVQTQHNLEENRWALNLAEGNDWIAGVVGWIDLTSDRCEEQLLEFKDHPKFVGIRHIVQDEPDDDFVVRDDVIRGLKVLEKHRFPYDLLFYAKHLRHAATLAERMPDLPMVIDHLSKPEIKLGRIDEWATELKAAARHPNVYCKLSGMVTEADWKSWKPAELKPYVQTALEAFGPGRLMFGSDWPVCLLAATYEQVVDALNETLGPISPDERAAIFGGTAINFYRLKV